MTAPDAGLDAWLAALAGRPAGAPAAMPQPERAEAALLRRLMTAQRAQRERTVQAPSAASEAAHWRRVRLRVLPVEPTTPPISVSALSAGMRTGLVGRRPRAGLAGLWQRLVRHHPFASALGATGLAVLLAWTLPIDGLLDAGGPQDADSIRILRGGEPVQELVAQAGKSARTQADELMVVLGRAGAPVHRVDLPGGAVQIQARVAVDGAWASALEALGVTVPPHGRLNLLLRDPERSRPAAQP